MPENSPVPSAGVVLPAALTGFVTILPPLVKIIADPLPPPAAARGIRTISPALFV